MKIKSTRAPSLHRSAPKPSAVAVAIGLALASQTAMALPEGGQVVAGQVAIQRPAAASLDIGQSTPKAVVDWRSFSIGSGEAVRIQQPSASATLLNRVVGEEPSRIFGQLSANGQVFLINPAGVMFAPGARLDVGSLTASTLRLSNEDFLAGRYHFTDGEKGGAVDNQGQIRVREGGYVALLGRQVVNSGSISAPGGNVALGAGERITLDLHGDGLLALKVDAAAARAKVSNTGAIDAEGGSVALSAHAKNALVDTVLNVEGTVRATGISQRNGEIYLDGGDSGAVTVSGTLDASGHAAQDTADSATTRHGGKITVVGETLALTGQAKLDATGDAGGGEILVGGGRQGQAISSPFHAAETPGVRATAKSATVEAGVTLDASATQGGQGGTAVVYADDEARFAGTAKAEGGTQGGDGGFVETSAHRVHIEPTAKVSTLAPKGKTGEWLTDPDDYTIASSGGDETGAQVSASLASSNRTIQTTAGGTGGNGDINVNDAVTWSNGNSLTLSAYHGVNVNAAITSNVAGDIALRADNTGACVTATANCGTVAFTGAGQVAVNGGNVGIYYNPTGSSGKADANGNIAGAYASPTDYTGKVSLGTGGTLSAYMLVNDVNQLQSMDTNLGGTYALGKDIDAAATHGWNGGAGFAPVGNGSSSASRFSGRFDGGGHVIDGLFINRPGTDNIGLFGATDKASQIRNVGLAGSDMTGQTGVGSLVGSHFGSITNTYATGSVTGQDFVGGLVGYSEGGTVRFSHSSGTVTAAQRSGGLIGGNWFGSTVEDSYSSSTVTGAGLFIGGLVGDHYYSSIVRSHASGAVTNSSLTTGGLVGYNHNSFIADSYATGKVTGTDSTGGLVGTSLTDPGGPTSTITRSYATGPVSGTTRTAGLVGENDRSDINNGYWDANTTGKSSAVGDTQNGGSQSNLVDISATPYAQASYAALDLATVWWMSAGDTRPFLRSEYSTAISNAHQLQLMATNLAASYTLANNIDLSELKSASGLWNKGTGFVPIGNPSNPFTGTLDGLGHTISGLAINRPTTDSVGLFGSTSATSRILDIGLQGGSVTGQGAVGALAGKNLGEITRAHSSATVSGTSRDGTGGLVGWNKGPITESHAAGNVTGRENILTGNWGVGGLVGENSGPILRSYATGLVGGNSNSVGGLLGANLGSVTDSYATGNVAGGQNLGGLVGWQAGTIMNSYSTGNVSGTGFFGGLVGLNFGGGITSIINSYWNTDTSGQVSSAGGTGLNTAQMQRQANFIGWDFATTWGMVDGVSYPYLQWQFPTAPPQIVSGTLGGSNVSGHSIQTAVDGLPLATTGTGANGYFYLALPNGRIASGTNLLAYLIGGSGNPAATVRLADGNTMAGLDLAPNLLTLGSNSSAPVSITNLLTAKGGLSTADIPYSVAGNNLILSNGVAFQTASGTQFTLNGDINAASQTYNGPVNLAVNATLSSGGSDIRFNNGAVNGVDFDLTLFTSGLVSQASSAALNVSGLELLGVGGIFNLAGADNRIGTLAAHTGTLRFKDNAGFNIGSINATAGITTGGDVTLDSAGTVTQSQAIDAPGLELLGGGLYDLAGADNHIITLAAHHTGTLRFKDSAGFNIGSVNATAGITASGDVALDSAGTVTQTEAIAAAGLALLGNGGDYRFGLTDNAIATLAGNTGTVRFHGSGGFAIGTVDGMTGLAASAGVTLDSAGIVTQTASIAAANLELLGGGRFDLAGADNHIGTLAAHASTLRFKDNAGFNIGSVNATAGITASGDVALDSAGTVTQTEAIAAAGLALLGSGGDYRFGQTDNAVATLAGNTGTVRFHGSDGFAIGTAGGIAGLAASGDVTLDSAGPVTQSQAITAAGLELLGGGLYKLAGADNHITTLAAHASTLRFKDDAGFTIGSVNTTAGITASGDVALDSAGTVTQTEAIAAPGLELLGGGRFDLMGADNQINTLAALASTLRFKDDAGFTIGSVNATAGLAASGDVTLDSAGTVTQTEAIAATGLELLNGTFALDSGVNKVATLAAKVAGGPLIYADSDGLAVGTVNGTVGITSGDQGVSLKAGGTVTVNATIDAGAGGVGIATSLGNIDGNTGNAIASNKLINLDAKGGIGIAGAINTNLGGTGALTLTTAGTGGTGDINVREAGTLNTGQVVSITTDPSTQILSLGTAKGAIILGGDIGNPNDDLNLIANGGDIVGGAGKAVADNLTLNATGGIGTATPVKTDTQGSLLLNAQGIGVNGNIAVIEANLLETSRVSLGTDPNSAQQVSLTSNTGIVLDSNIGNTKDDLALAANGGDIVGGPGKAVANNLTLGATGNIGTGSPVNTDTLGNLTLATTGITAVGDIAVIEANALETSRVALSTSPNSAQQVSLASNAGITLDADIGHSDDDLNLIANGGDIAGGAGKAVADNLTLSATGSIGTATPVNTDTQGGLLLIAQGNGATGDIAVVEANLLETSRVSLGTDPNSAQQVSLTSKTGIVLDAVIGNTKDDLTLAADGGDITGGGSIAFANNLTLSATGNIGIGAPVNTDTLGKLALTTTGTTAAGDIAVIEANALETSRVALSTSPNSAQQVSLASNAGITLDADIGHPDDALSLIANGGGIVGGTGKALANSLLLQAQTGIGSKDAPVLTAAAALAAFNGGSGDVVIRNVGDVRVEGSNSGGGMLDFTVDAGKTLTVGGGYLGGIISNGGAINLTADKMDIVGQVSASSGLITLTPKNIENTAVWVGGNATDCNAADCKPAGGIGVLAIDSSEASLFFGSGGLSIISPKQGIQFTGAAGFFGLAGIDGLPGGKLTFSTDSAITRDPQSEGQLLTTDASTMINLLAQTGIGQQNNPIVLNTQGGKMLAQNSGTGGVFLDFKGTTILGGDGGSKISADPSGTIKVTSSGDIIMHGTIGDGSQPITLQSSEGGIFGNSAGLVFAPDITLLASLGIGTADAPLNTQASGTLTLGSTSGGIFVKNQGSVKLATTALASDAPLSVVSTGTLTMPASAITAGTIDLESQGGRLNVKGELSATNGEIKLLGSQGISLANNLTTNNADITLDGAVLLPVDPTINAGSGNVGFKQTLEGPQDLSINTSGTVSFAGAVGTNSPLAYLSVTGGGPILFASSLVRTTGLQTYQGPVTGTDMRFESANGDITATNSSNQFNGTVSASGNIVNLTADRLNVGLAGITGRQINLTANAITTLGTIRSTGANPGETGLSLVGLTSEGGFGTFSAPLAVDVNNRFTVSPDSFNASIVYLAGPTNAGITFDNGSNHRQIDYNGSLSRANNLRPGELLASTNATFGMLPTSVKSANKVVFEIDYGKDLLLRKTEIVALGLRLPEDGQSTRKSDKPEPSDRRIDATLEPTRLPPFEPAKMPAKGDFNTRLMVQLERWFTQDSGIAMRPLLAERLESGYARENVRKKLAQGIVLETGVAAAALGDITDEGIKLQNKRGCGAVLLASWAVSVGCQ